MTGEQNKLPSFEPLKPGSHMKRKRSRIEDHFNVNEDFRLLGPLKYDDNFWRDVHDWFNLVALLPVIYLNTINWTGQPIYEWMRGATTRTPTLVEVWSGTFEELFWYVSFAYFVSDFLFVVLVPKCVKSPAIIIGHHIAAMTYMIVPRVFPEYMCLMGAIMLVEVNTWFLIARRALNSRGEKPFTPGVSLGKSLRMTFISANFYFSWIFHRCIVNLYVLIYILHQYYVWITEFNHFPIDIRLISVSLQAVLILLNTKWTVDLVRSKLKGRNPGKGL